MNFGLSDMIIAFFFGLFIGAIFGFFSFALCAIKREENLKYGEDLFD